MKFKNKYTIDIIMFFGIFFLLFVYLLRPECIFKIILLFPCISCGLTRGILSILHFRIIDSLRYNILSIPIFISIIVIYFVYFISRLFNKKYIEYLLSLIINKYIFIIIFILLSWICNVVIYISGNSLL